MKTRVITGIIITLTVAAILLPAAAIPQLAVFFFFIVAVLSIIELTTVIKHKIPDISQSVTVVGSIGVFIPILPVLIHGDLGWKLITVARNSSPNEVIKDRAALLNYVSEATNYMVLFFILFFFVSVLYILSSKGPAKIIEALITPIVTLYIVVPMSCAVMLLYIFPNGYLWMLAAIVSAWITDVFAFFAGVTLGKHKIVPHISPKKTWEGTIGGVVGTIFISIFWMAVIMGGPDIVDKSLAFSLSFGVVLGISTSIISQLGDWFASIIKRQAGVKDYGTLLPGHGGIMDRFDGVFFTMPVMVLAALAYYIF